MDRGVHRSRAGLREPEMREMREMRPDQVGGERAILPIKTGPARTRFCFYLLPASA